MAAMHDDQVHKEFEDYQEGKTKKLEDFGIMYPHGGIVWGAFSKPLPDGPGFSINTAEGQAGWLKEYIRVYNELRLEDTTPKVLPTFVKRIVKTSYSQFLPNNLA